MVLKEKIFLKLIFRKPSVCWVMLLCLQYVYILLSGGHENIFLLFC
jgi:hypothetical protein